jgi:hypothetical protein
LTLLLFNLKTTVMSPENIFQKEELTPILR